MREITLEELLAAGCHFGHQINRKNPKANSYIFEARSNINIINLEKTHAGLMKAGEFVKNLAARNGSMIIVGTKRQAKPIVEEEVGRALSGGASNIYYVTARWVGGTLTNYSEVVKNFKKLKDLREFLAKEDKGEYTKREVLEFSREKDKLENLYGGLTDLSKSPDVLFIIDTHHETTAVDEATKMKVATIGITDTNADPSLIDYPIPANDDAVGSIKVITSYLVDAWIEGRREGIKVEEKKAKEVEKEEAKEAAKKEAEEAKAAKETPVAV